MAETVTIRHKRTQQTREVAKSAVAFFPDYEVLDKAGRRAATQPANTDKKD